MKLSLKPKILDGLVLILLIAFTIISPRLLPASVAGQMLVISTPSQVFEISLKNDGRYAVSGPLGEASLVVREGKADLVNAPCPLKICEGMGPISEIGQVIVCLPNRISVRVAGEGEVDAVTR